MSAMKEHAMTNRLGPFAGKEGPPLAPFRTSITGPDEITLEIGGHEHHLTRAEAGRLADWLGIDFQESDPQAAIDAARDEAFANGDLDPDAANELAAERMAEYAEEIGERNQDVALGKAAFYEKRGW